MIFRSRAAAAITGNIRIYFAINTGRVWNYVLSVKQCPLQTVGGANMLSTIWHCTVAVVQLSDIYSTILVRPPGP